MIYLDTSAALKLVASEAETTTLELWIAERAGIPRVSSRLLRIEMLRSVARTIATAVRAAKPRRHYTSGTEARAAGLLAGLPAGIKERLITRLLGI